MTQWIKIFYCSNLENELRSCHNKTDWANCVRMQDFWLLLKSDSISWRKTLRNSHNFMQWRVVNTLFQGKKKHHNQKDWSKGTPRLGLGWKSQSVTCTVNMELKLELCLRAEILLTRRLEFFMDQINLWWIWKNNDTEIPEDQLEDQALQLDAKDFESQATAKAKPQRREPTGSSSKIIPKERRNWIDIEPEKYSVLSEYEVSKKVIHLLRHSQQVYREEDGAVHFWRIKENLQNPFPQSIHWSDDRWKACLAVGGGARRRFQYCTDDTRANFYFRAHQGHSGRNLIDPSLKDNVVIPSGFFQ